MNLLNKIATIYIAVLAVSACNKINSPAQDEGLMQFDAIHPARTAKAAQNTQSTQAVQTKATDAEFEADDKIGVYITGYEGEQPLELELGGNYKNNNAVIFDGHDWHATPAIYWGNKFEKFDIYAYYQYGDPQSIKEMAFEVAADQTVAETPDYMSGYESSDFLFASCKGVTPEYGKINLKFSHRMSKLTVKLVKGPDYDGELPTKDVNVLILNTVTKSIIDLSTGDVIKHPRAATKNITAKREATDRFTAIVVPQMINYNIPLIEINCGNVCYIVNSRFHFKSGIHHTINVTLNNNPEKVEIEIGGEIEGGWD